MTQPTVPTPAPAEEQVSQFDPTSAVGSVEAAFDADGEALGPEFDQKYGKGTGKKLPPPSPHVLKLDEWSIRKGKRLADDEMHKKMVVTGETNAVELADAHSACFEMEVQFHERPKDDDRSKWFQALFQTPEFLSMREQTNFDLALSDVACSTVTKQWVEYKKVKKQGEDEDMARMRSAAKCARETKNAVQEADAVARAFGLERGNRMHQDPKRMLELFKKIKKNPSLNRIVELAGRYRRLAQARQRVKDVHSEDEIMDVQLSGEISRMLGSEFSRFAIEELELDLLIRIVDRRAMCYEMSGFKHVAKGPIMVLLDESGSMSGNPNEQAKAMALALAWVAKSQGRWCALVSWSGPGQYNFVSLPPGEWEGVKVAEWCCGFIGGGTTPPIQHIDKIFQETGAIDGKTDMIWISDGCASISEDDAKVYNAWCEEHHARSIALLVAQDDAAFRLICNDVHVVKRMDVSEDAIGEVLSI